MAKAAKSHRDDLRLKRSLLAALRAIALRDFPIRRRHLFPINSALLMLAYKGNLYGKLEIRTPPYC